LHPGDFAEALEEQPKDTMNSIDRPTGNEKMRPHGRAARPRLALKGLTVSVMLAFGSGAWALPTGGVVVEGAANIVPGAGKTTINQSSQNAAINWQSFSIGKSEAVQFVQPNANSVALNRVLGSDGSSILGSLSANGKVFLVNPNGILFGRGAEVNVGSLVASTRDIGNADFMAGRYKFSGAGTGSVVNEGSINANGGYVALLGASVSNQGTIQANLGTVALAAGNAMTLDVAGDGLLNVTVDQGAVNALVDNGGLIRADGGQVLLTAQAAGNLLTTVVNNSGVIEARSFVSHNGTIKLLGDMQTGTVNVGGTLDASAPDGGNGGFIETSAAHVRVQDSARVTTAAAQGLTGTWLIDPVDYTIAASSGDITGAQLSASLGSTNVTILSSSGAAGVNGDVNVSDVVSWSANKLTLNAQRNININAVMNGTGTASLALEYGQATVTSGNLAKYIVLAPVNLPAGNNFSTRLGNNGTVTNYTVITSLGSQGSVSTTDLQGMSGNLNGHYALGGNIDASPTAAWNGGFGFDPVGTIGGPTSFTGNFDGLGHTITGLTIARPTDNVGLFGFAVSTGGAMLKNVTLSGGSVTGANYVGNLVGHIAGDIDNVHTAQVVTGTGAVETYAGGVAGWSTGNISNSSSTARVTGSGDYVGGIVGWITGNITCCFATGPITGAGSYHGGLAGWVTGDVSRSYATGNVSATAGFVGGLVGWITGNVSNSYAQGNVTTGGGNVGGLLGWKTGNVTNTYSSGAVTTPVATVGGLIGADLGGTTTASFWDTTTSGQPLSAGGAGARGMPSAEMKKQINFTSSTPANGLMSPAPAWDFANIWTMTTEGVTYPTLLACLAPVVWTAVPALAVPPAVIATVVAPVVLPPVLVAALVPAGLGLIATAVSGTSPDILDTADSSPLIQNAVGSFGGGPGGLNLSVEGTGVRMPGTQLAESAFAPPAPPAPPVVFVAPPEAPPVIAPRAVPPPVVAPLQPVFVPPVRPRRQDRN
jgi:filamentous hemagglutinin family protein